jgi:hypothetical protein
MNYGGRANIYPTMTKTLLALLTTSLLGCMATVGPAQRNPPPPPAEPPPAGPPPHHHREPEPRIIEGTVRDAITHQPIDRAAVDISIPGQRGEMTVNTGPDGRYRTGEIPRGEFGLRCRREGYEVYQQRAMMSDGVAHIDFELTPKRR